ncbi:MAG: phosphate ABC transporter permease subunit PstC [Bacilli bacterium]
MESTDITNEILIEKACKIFQTNAEKSAKRKLVTDKIVKNIFLGITVFCASIIIIVTGFIIVKGVMPFIATYSENGNTGKVDIGYFLTGMRFSSGYDSDSGQFLYGVGFLIINTLILNILVSIIAVPTAILTALFIAKIAPKAVSKIFQAAIDLLAAIPSVIYGIFGVGVIVPLIRSFANSIGYVSSSGISMLSGALVLALMILPTIISVSVTALNAVDENQIKGSLALGASKTQTNFRISLGNAKSGIFAGIILGIGRSLGEATAVSMICGSPTFGITINPLDPTVTISSQMLLAIGEAVPGSLNYDVRFSAGICLMIIIIITNLILNDVKEHVSSVDKKPLFITKVFLLIKKETLTVFYFLKEKLNHEKKLGSRK